MRELSRREETARDSYLKTIRDTRKRFRKDFPEGCRVEFSPKEPTIRTGKGTIVKVYDSSERECRVKYILDDYDPHKTQDCAISTFLSDNPRRIDK